MSIFEYDEEATLQYIRECEFAQGEKAGRLAGREEGKAEGICSSVLLLLNTKGEITEDLYSFITSETNMKILQDWLKLASESNSVEEFEKAIQNRRE